MALSKDLRAQAFKSLNAAMMECKTRGLEGPYYTAHQAAVLSLIASRWEFNGGLADWNTWIPIIDQANQEAGENYSPLPNNSQNFWRKFEIRGGRCFLRGANVIAPVLAHLDHHGGATLSNLENMGMVDGFRTIIWKAKTSLERELKNDGGFAFTSTGILQATPVSAYTNDQSMLRKAMQEIAELKAALDVEGSKVQQITNDHMVDLRGMVSTQNLHISDQSKRNAAITAAIKEVATGGSAATKESIKDVATGGAAATAAIKEVARGAIDHFGSLQQQRRWSHSTGSRLGLQVQPNALPVVGSHNLESPSIAIEQLKDRVLLLETENADKQYEELQDNVPGFSGKLAQIIIE